MTIEEFLAQQPNTKKACEKILGRNKPFSRSTWLRWERIVGACYPQGKKISDRSYTDEQTQLFICLAWMRKLFPKKEINYRNLRQFFASNEYKVEELLDRCCNAEPIPPEPEIGMVPLSKVKACCDAIAGAEIRRTAWAKWKQHLQIAHRVKYVEEGKASLLVYMACWRHDNPKKPFPSITRLQMLMEYASCPQISLETASSAKMRHQWAMQGCKGKDLARYLTAQGYKVSLPTLYKWGGFSQKRHYSVSELTEWRKKAADRRRCA
jgi:hypothetical protein